MMCQWGGPDQMQVLLGALQPLRARYSEVLSQHNEAIKFSGPTAINRSCQIISIFTILPLNAITL